MLLALTRALEATIAAMTWHRARSRCEQFLRQWDATILGGANSLYVVGLRPEVLEVLGTAQLKRIQVGRAAPSAVSWTLVLIPLLGVGSY
jgi:hypothetical protein